MRSGLSDKSQLHLASYELLVRLGMLPFHAEAIAKVAKIGLNLYSLFSCVVSSLSFKQALEVAKLKYSDLYTTNLRDIEPLPNYQNRGSEEKIASFIGNNLKAYQSRSTQKQLYHFLYVINGSGMGKTWAGKNSKFFFLTIVGKHIGAVIKDHFKSVPHLFMYLDFSNQNR